MKLAINPNYIYLEEEEGGSYFDPDHSTLYSCNDTARLIIELIEKGHDKKDIAAVLSESYDVSNKQVEYSISKTIEKACRVKILVPISNTT